MGYLKRNINILLIIIAVIAVGYTLTVTTYYQSTFQNVTLKYYEQVEEYEQLISNFQEREQKLNETRFDLTRRTQDVSKLNVLYTDVVDERDTLETDLSSTRSTLVSTESELSTKKIQLSNLQADLAVIEDKVDTLASRVDNAKDDLDDNDYNITSGQIDDIFDNVDDTVSDLQSLT